MGGGARAAAARVTRVTERPALAEDVDAVLAIERAAFSDPWSRGSFTSLLSDPRVFFAVTENEEGDVTGYAVAFFVVDEAELANLAAAPSVRRRGVGGLLLDAVLREARRRGTRELFLEVRESNAAARALYASRGFAEVGRRRGYYRRPLEDALVLRLGLDE